MATLTVSPPQVRQDATALLVFLGQPNVSLAWSLEGSGSIVGGNRTDAQGQAHAIYTPGVAGDTVVISVTHGL